MAFPLSTQDAIRCIGRQIADLRANRGVVPWRSGPDWPSPDEVPAGTGIVWWNTTVPAARLYINVPGGALHYVTFTT